MPKRNLKRSQPPTKLVMRQHMASFGGELFYQCWCRNVGFPDHCQKTACEREQETLVLAGQREAVRKRASLYRHPERLLESICLNQLQTEDVPQGFWRNMASELRTSGIAANDRGELLSFLRHLHKVSDLVLERTEFNGRDAAYFPALLRVFENKRYWLRNIEDWSATTHNAGRQFRSLLAHLFELHATPRFFQQAWFDGGSRGATHRDWYIHVGRGLNIRTANTPVRLTKMMAHHMMGAPDHIGIDAALRWGQVFALGGGRQLAEAILASRIGEQFENNDFWLTVVAFFVQHPFFDLAQVTPVIDYLNEQKFEPRDVLGDNGHIVRLPPVQPNLSMNGRSPEALLAQVGRWHRQLAKAKGVSGDAFPTSGFAPFKLEVGHNKEEIWRIRELRSALELREEGRKLKHCVLSYTASCLKGTNSIWTMEVELPGGIFEKRQTIQVMRDGRIVQCRGKMNRLPNAQEFHMLERWARAAGLVVGVGKAG